MNKHFIILAIRNILKNKLSTIINVIGLSISLAAFIMITIYVSFEYSYDTYNVNCNQIYKIENERVLANKRDFSTAVPYPLAGKLVEDFPEIIDAFKVKNSEMSIKYKDQKFNEFNSIFSENSIFNILTIPFISGNPQLALKSPTDIVITESYATKLFGDDEALNKEIELNNSIQLKVAGVIKDFPKNSHIRPDVIVSLDAEIDPIYYANQWGDNFIETYVLLDKNTNWKDAEHKIKDFLNNYKENATRYLHLNKLANVHLHPNKETDLSKVVITLGVSGFLILLIAFLNYVNLNMAANANRDKEVSIKKLAGSSRASILWQFIGESLIIAFFAFDLSLIIVEKLLVKFSNLLGSDVGLINFHNLGLIAVIFVFVIILGSLSGILSGFNVSKAKVLRSVSTKRRYLFNFNYKKILLGIQFVISIIMIVLTLSMVKQFKYLKNKDLGFDKDNLLITQVIDINQNYEKLQSLKSELKKMAGVKSCSYSFNVPYLSSNGKYITKTENEESEFYKFRINYVDKDFMETYKVEIIEGDGFDRLHSDISHLYCLINEAGAKVLGWDNPIGKMIYYNDLKCEIVGIIKDFHIYSINWEIPPVFLVDMPAENNQLYKYLAVNANKLNIDKIRDTATEKLQELFPDSHDSFISMNYFNLNNEVYMQAKGTGKILSVFSILAIFISCMGVFGFVNIHLKQRTKEIGIRKALGSSLSQIFKLILKDFLILIIISTLISIPVSIYFIRIIFQEYAYTTSVGVGIYLLTVLTVLIFTLISITFHSIKAARTNPVEALRYE